MSITKISHFRNDVFLPLTNELVPSLTDASPSNRVALQETIDIVEREILVNALGLDLYNQLQTALEDFENADQKWKDLVNGLEYEGKVWIGLDNPKSLLVYAVFALFLEQTTNQVTQLGVERVQANGSKAVSNIQKIAYGSRNFHFKYQQGAMLEPLRVGNFIDYYGQTDDVFVSFYQFLLDKKDVYDFDTANFKIYPEPINSFGL